MLLERQTDRVSHHLCRDGMKRQALLRNTARKLGAMFAGLHPRDGGSQDRVCALRARMGRGGENGKPFRPIAKLADRDIDLQRIERAFDQGVERTQRAPAVEAEQRADLLCAAAVRSLLAGENRGGHIGAGALRRAHRRHRRIERGTGLTLCRELARALAPHEPPKLRGLVVHLAAQRGGDFLVQRVRHEPAADQHGCAAALLMRPFCNRAPHIAQRSQVLDEGERPRRGQHVDTAAHEELRGAIPRDQRQRRFELGGEIGEIGELGVVHPVAVDDGA